MADIAQLGIAVDTSQTKLAARELDNLAQAGGRAETSTKNLGSTSQRTMTEIAAATQKSQQALERMAAAQERQEKLTQQLAREMQQLTQALNSAQTANNAAAQAASNAAQALGQQAGASKSAGAAATAQAQAASNAAQASGAMGQQATAAGAAMGGLAGRIMGTVTAVLSLNKAIQEMDAWTNMNNRIKLVTETQGQFTQAQANIISIANSTRQPLKETADLYQRLATNQKALGLSGNELAGVVKTISQSMVISGASAASGAAALMQLGQAFNSGVLRGEEFNSVMEQAPGLMQAIAAGMGKTVGEMRGLAEAGKITTEELVKALQKQAGAVEENFGKMGSTVGQSLTVAGNKFAEFVGRMDDATGVSKALSGAIIGMSDNMGPLVTMTGALVAAGLATWLTTATTAAGGFTIAATAAGVAVKGLLASIGPAGWLILGLGAAATAWQLLGNKASTAGTQMEGASDKASAAANKLVAGIVPALNTAIAAYDKMIAKQKESMGIAKTPVEEMAKGLKEADINLQKLAQQVARARQGTGEYVNMGPTQRAAAEKALTTELEKASKVRGELAKKEAEYNGNVVTQYVKGKERQTEATQKLLDIEKAKESRDKAMAAAGADRAQQDRVNAAYRLELAKIEESYNKKGASGIKAAAKEAKQAAKDQADAYADLAGVSSTYYKDLANYQTQRAKGNITEAQYVQLVEQLIQKQPFATAQVKEATEAWKEQEKARKEASKAVEKAYEDEVKAVERSAQSVTDKAASLKIEEAALALVSEGNISLSQAIELVMIKRLEERAIIAKDAGNQELLDAINAEIEARKELIKVTGTKEARDASTKAADQAAKDWQKTADEISNGLTDALMRGFEGGKDAAQNMRDTIVNMFKTMVLKPVIQAIITPVAGGIAGMFGGTAQAAQAGSGLLGGASNIASLAGSLGSFGTALGAGASMATSGLAGFTTALEGGVAMLGSATGFSSAMAGIGQLAGALGPVALGVTALASIFSQRATPHTGGVAQYSAIGGTQTSNQGGMFNTGFSAVHYGEDAIKTVASLAKAVVTELDKTAASFGKEAGYEMAAAFADDASGDGAWGALRISQGGQDIVNWSQDTSKWLQREFADGEKGLEEFMNAVAADVVTVLKDMDLPGWAGRFAAAMPDGASMEQVNALLATLREYPNKLLEMAGTSRDALVQVFAEGLMTGNIKTAGQNVANTLVASIEQTVIQGGAAQIFDTVNQGIVTPMLDALLMGAQVSEALSQEAIDKVIERATAQAQALGQLLNSPEFQAALQNIKTSVGQALGNAASQIQYQPRYQLTQAEVAPQQTQAQDVAIKAAEDLAKKIQDAIDGVKTDSLQLQIDLLRETGDEAGAAMLELNRATKGWGEDKREEYRLLLQESAALKESLRIAQSLNKLREESTSLEIELMRVQGDEAGALAKETAIATAKMSEQEKAVYNANRALEKQISTQESLNALNTEAADLAIQLLRAQGNEEAALNAEREIGIEGMTALEVAQYDANRATRNLIESLDKLKSRTESVKSALGVGELPSVKFGSTAGLGEVGAAKVKVTGFEQLIESLNGAYEDIVKEMLVDIGDGVTIASDLGVDASSGTLKGLSKEQLSALVDVANSYATNATPGQIEIIDAVIQKIGTVSELNDKYTQAVEDLAQAQSDLTSASEKQAQDAAKAVSSFDFDVASTKRRADISLLQAQGKPDEAASLEREDYIASLWELTDTQKAAKTEAYDYTKSIEAQIEALTITKRLTEEKTGLDIALLRAQGKEQDALALERTKAIAGMTEEQIAIYDGNQSIRDRIAAIEKEKVIAQERSSLEQQILQLLGRTDELRKRELESLDESNRALQQRIWALEDAKEATANALDAVAKAVEQEKQRIQEASDKRLEVLQKELDIAQQRSGLEQSALQLLGNTTELRRRELEALDGTNQALQQRVWAVEDAGSNMDNALALVQRSVNAEKQRISESAQAQIDAINAAQESRKDAIDAAQKAVNDLNGLFDSIAETIKTLRGNVLTEQQNMEQARAYIAMSLSVARAGGDVNQERLTQAMQTVSGDTAETYRTGAEFRYQQARQAAVLDELGGIIGGRVGAAETQLEALNSANELAQEQIKAITDARDAQIKALDAQLKTAEDAVSVAKGIDISTIAVGDAVTGLNDAIDVYEAVRDTLAREQLSIGHQTVIALETQIEREQESTAAIIAALDSQYTKAQEQVNAINGVNSSVLSVQAAISGLASAISAQAATQAAAAQAAAMATITSQQVAIVGDGNTMPSFDVGTNYVPRDMLAQIHEGEAIVPKEFNPAIFNKNGASNAELVQLVATLTAEVKRLQDLQREGNKEQRRTANAVNGQGEAPMLVETV